MNIVLKFLDEEDILEIKEKYNETVYEKLEEENILKILYYLTSQSIDFIKDIMIYYLDLFLLEEKQFIKKFEIIKTKYGENYIEIIGNNFSIMEEMYL